MGRREKGAETGTHTCAHHLLRLGEADPAKRGQVPLGKAIDHPWLPTPKHGLPLHQPPHTGAILATR